MAIFYLINPIILVFLIELIRLIRDIIHLIQ